MGTYRFHLLISAYSTIIFQARMDSAPANGRLSLVLEESDLIRAVRRGMRCRIMNESESIAGVVRALDGRRVTFSKFKKKEVSN